MENQIKLKRTICGMLPYGLKGITKKENSGIETVLGYMDDGVNAEVYTTVDTCLIENFKPLLHSMEKLIDNIYHDGDENDYFYYLNLGLCDILEVIDCTNFIKAIIENKYYASNINKAILGIEYLKENHFNIDDLPKEMYIEKTTLNQ